MSQSTAFVYSWKNKISGKIYVGYHKGTPIDGYICSSKILLEEYAQNPNNFERFIIASGTVEDMVALESAILKAANAKNDPTFYNMTNGDRYFCNKGHTEETKDKISKANSNRVLSEQSRKNMSEGRKGKKFAKRGPLSDEVRLKISKSMQGKQVGRQAWNKGLTAIKDPRVAAIYSK